MQGKQQGYNSCHADGASAEVRHRHAHEYHGERMPHGPRVALREGWRHDVAQRLINHIGQHGSYCDPACIDLATEGTRQPHGQSDMAEQQQTLSGIVYTYYMLTYL